MKISTRITANTISPALRKKLAQVKDLRPVLQAGAVVVVEDAKRAFRAPSLRPLSWKPLKAATIRRKAAKGQSRAILIQDAVLIRSPRITSIDRRRVLMGSDRPYAAFHQYGTKRIPARPFWPFRGAQITAKAKRKVEGAMKRRLASMGIR